MNCPMFTFRHPLLLLLLLAIPLVAVWLRMRRKAPTFATSDIASLEALPRSPWLQLRWLGPAALALAAVLLVVAAAGPRAGIRRARAETEGVDIVLLVDTSTSMNATDLSNGGMAGQRATRLDVAKSVIRTFVDNRPDDRIGIVAFSAMPFTLAPLTTDHPWLQQQIDRLQTGMLPEDATAIGDAIASAVNRLRPSQAKSKLVILLTDGINNAGRLAPLNAAQAAAALGIKVYAVGAASDQPQTVSGFFGMRVAVPGAEIDEETLRKVAELTGAQYFRATDSDSLAAIYEEIDQLEKTPVTLDSYTQYKELFAPFAAGAALCLLLALLLHATPLAELPT